MRKETRFLSLLHLKKRKNPVFRNIYRNDSPNIDIFADIDRIIDKKRLKQATNTLQ